MCRLVPGNTLGIPLLNHLLDRAPVRQEIDEIAEKHPGQGQQALKESVVLRDKDCSLHDSIRHEQDVNP